MENTIGIAITGLNSASLRLYASASNIAHIRSTGSLTDENYPAYEAKTTQSTTTGSGGVLTKIVTREPSTTISFDSNAPYADENGMVKAPYVNLEEELVTMKMAEQAYKANAETIRAQGKMFDTLIGIMKED
ncbi:MAG: hypothetical protein KAJ29_01725 [Alphaproteobacteria bacterium]|nr:hypothetical protein [Alphaproteobacteria bacterium]